MYVQKLIAVKRLLLFIELKKNFLKVRSKNLGLLTNLSVIKSKRV